MDHIQRDDIEAVARHSLLSEKTLGIALQKQVYPDAKDWKRFLTLLFLTLGVGFSLAGIIFFFAYNWADLHKFAKLGLVELLLIVSTGLAWWPKLNGLTRQIVLTGSAVLVGLLFAVFGQIYQTGADAYDFFLAWTIFITLWVGVANFAPLWLLYVVLLNTTLILYKEQVTDWPPLLLYGILFIANGFIYIIARLRQAPAYFVHTIGVAAFTFATIGMISGIFSYNKDYLSILAPVVILAYIAGLWQGIRTQSTFYLSAIPFSAITIISAYMIDFSNDEWMWLTVSLFVIISVTLVVRNLIQIAKKQSS